MAKETAAASLDARKASVTERIQQVFCYDRRASGELLGGVFMQPCSSASRGVEARCYDLYSFFRADIVSDCPNLMYSTVEMLNSDVVAPKALRSVVGVIGRRLAPLRAIVMRK